MGKTFFLIKFTPLGGKRFVRFAGNTSGGIIFLETSDVKDFIVQKDAFLCAGDGVDSSVIFQRRLGSIFLRERFILEKLSGKGIAFTNACRDFVEIDLKKGESIKVDTGSL